MNPPRPALTTAYWTLAVLLLAAGVAMAGLYAPTEPTMGPIQKIVYLHVPVAINTFLACVVVFIANIGYIWQRGSAWDDLGAAAAQVAVLCCSVVLLTGMVWAFRAWGHWWVWSPLLTFSLVLWLLYLTYLGIWWGIGSVTRRAIVCASFGVIAFLDVPLVYLSVKLLPDKHPSDARLTTEMRNTLLFWLVPITMVCAGLIIARFRANARARSTAPQCPVGTGARAATGIRP